MAPELRLPVPEAEDKDLAAAAEALQALANANRLRLLRWLRVPTAAGDIPLHPGSVREGENPDRVMTRQGVRSHLKILAEVGLVEVRRGERPTGPVDEFVLSHQAVYALLERLRVLTAVTPESPVDTRTTMQAPRATAPQLPPGPRLIVVKGREEGRVFPLMRKDLPPERGWVVGRKEGVAVRLDYDPFVSGENSEILPDGQGYKVLDLRTSTNGTMVNFHRLPKGGEGKVQPGDVIGIGASLLVFQVG